MTKKRVLRNTYSRDEQHFQGMHEKNGRYSQFKHKHKEKTLYLNRKIFYLLWNILRRWGSMRSWSL